MGRQRKQSVFRQLGALFSGGARKASAQDVRRVEAKQRTLSQATEQWLSLLREMETRGETSDARYETYYQAYLQAKQQQKRVDLELFNLRQGLSG